jgi:hypothetical protein
VLGLDLVTSEDGASCVAVPSLTCHRDFRGVQLVISDCHKRVRGAIAAVLPVPAGKDVAPLPGTTALFSLLGSSDDALLVSNLVV